MKEIQGKPQNVQLVSTNGSHQVNGQIKKCVCSNKGKHKNINLFICFFHVRQELLCNSLTNERS